jgi:indolepyruvate ferredoxin oxidoreductase
MQIVDSESVERARRAAGQGGSDPAHVAVKTRRPSRGAARRLEALGITDSRLAAELERYAAELEAWGGRLVTRRPAGRAIGVWLEVVERVARAERAIEAPVGAGRDALVAAVAAGLFKLLAYKDEYEVARLMLDEDGMAAVRAVAGERGRIAWRLHPPILRAMGMRQKLAIGVWATPLIRMLARLRGLRGTPIDVFGWAHVRREERRLPGEYIAVLDRILPRLARENLAGAVALAALPDRVRGYERIKLARIAGYREALARAESELLSGRHDD